jgi:hypothetical protein
MNDPRDLRGVQEWMLSTITHPAGVVAGSSTQPIDDLILPSRQQTATERLAVYSSAYFARLLEVLSELFPCLRFALGDELFAQFAVGYLQQHPPASYTLHRLADHLAEFLEATRPADDDAARFVVDLARLEHAIDQVFDDAGPENVTPSNTSTAGNRPLPLVPGFRLLAFRFPVSSYFTAWKAGRSPSWPPPQEQFVALLRRDYIVRRHELAPVQFGLLSHLAAGCSLDDSLASIAADPAGVDELATDVQRWFTQWSAAGFFAAPCETEPPAA